MSSNDWQELLGVIGVFVLLTSVATVSIWQFAATSRAKALLARESEYRSLADKAVVVQEGTERRLTEITGQLVEVQTRLKSLELILKDVE